MKTNLVKQHQRRADTEHLQANGRIRWTCI